MAKADRVASNAAIASVSSAATMITGGALAIIVAATIGNTAQTDGFFAAFAVYSMVVAFAQSARTTIIARLLESDTRFGALDRYLGAALLLFVVVLVAFVPLGAVIARLLTGGLPAAATDTARTSLLLFAPAAGLQLFAALGAAMLGALGDFAMAGVAFVVGSLISIVGFVALRGPLGIDALPTGLLIGSVFSATVVAVALLRESWRPAASTVTRPRESARAAGVLLISSVSFLIAQLGYVVVLAVGARLGVGVVTVFSYANMAMGLIQALFVSSVPMVLAAPLSRTWDRRPESLLPHHEAVLRAGMLLVVPVFAAAALVGTDVAGVVLAQFDEAQVRLVIGLFLILGLNVVWGLLNTVPYAALVGIGRYVALAVLTGGVVAVQVVIALVAGALDSVWLLAAGLPISTAATVVGAFRLVSPAYGRLAVVPLGLIVGRFALVGLAAFGLPWLLVRALGLAAPGWIALVVGAVVYLAAVTRVAADRDIVSRLLLMLPLPRAATPR